MKAIARKLFILLFAASVMSFVGCDDDDDFIPDSTLINALKEMYPSAQKISWEQKSDFIVADFIFNNQEVESWFDIQGNWFMTETDIRFDELPLPVQEHFVLSQYADWEIEDVDMIERYNTEVIYIIEVEKNDQEIELVYDENGGVIKELTEGVGESQQPLVLVKDITDFIANKYSGAKIMGYKMEGNDVVVDILYNNYYREAKFDTAGYWIGTVWKIDKDNLPENVLKLIKEEFSDKKIAEIRLRETPTRKDCLLKIEVSENVYVLYIANLPTGETVLS